MVEVREVMSRDVATVASDASVADAAKCMVQGGFGSVIVVHGKMIVGILTERDVLRAAAHETDLSCASVEPWMTPDPETAEPDLETEDAAEMMLSRGFRHLPVTEGGDLVGIVSLRDVLSARIGRR
ncbi:MAG: CBS domain-containing protein, partial [Acidimicrobiales bacterium]|jgi:CBS domain-containing protein|nr:CBS domain-containing protein [Acidimicrobiales bacterium]